jgi:hypothetical protein
VSEADKSLIGNHNIDLVLCILRGGDEPKLPASDLRRIIEAGKRYTSFMKKRPSQLAQARCDDPSVRLVLDLKFYLKLVSQDRDATIVREMLGEDKVAEALELVCGPIVTLIKRVYRAGNAAALLGEIQKIMDQLIISLYFLLRPTLFVHN